jgi:hypothetical protein
VINEYTEAEARAAARPPIHIAVEDDDPPQSRPEALPQGPQPPSSHVPVDGAPPPPSLTDAPVNGTSTHVPVDGNPQPPASTPSLPSPLLGLSPRAVHTPLKVHSPVNSNALSSPWDMNCTGCGYIGPGSAADGETVLCDRCGKWSHVLCMQAADPTLDTDNLESIDWICPDCTDISDQKTWNGDL